MPPLYLTPSIPLRRNILKKTSTSLAEYECISYREVIGDVLAYGYAWNHYFSLVLDSDLLS